MPEPRAPYEELEGQLDMWRDYATTQCNRVRAKNKPPEPDSDGLFDATGVTEICGRRQCVAAFVSEFAATVTHKTIQVPLTAIAPAILKACSAACGRESFDVDEAKVQVTCDFLNEVKIARVVAAEGLRPYLKRQGDYRRAGNVVRHPPNGLFRRLLQEDYIDADILDPPREDHRLEIAKAGMHTWSFFQVSYVNSFPGGKATKSGGPSARSKTLA